MKKIYLLGLIFFISGMAFSQQFIRNSIMQSANNYQALKRLQNPNSTFRIQASGNKKQMDSVIVQMKGSGNWIKFMKILYIYDPSENQLSNTTFDFNSNTWKKDQKQTYSYDASGQITETISSSWDTTSNQWVDNSKTIMSRVSNLYTEEYLSWNGSTNQWEKQSKQEFYSNQNNKDTLKLEYSWISNHWKNEYKNRYIYNSNNDIILELSQRTISGIWSNSDKIEYSYDGNNKLIEELYFNWIIPTQSFVHFDKNIMGYDNQNNMIYELSYNYDTTNTTWIKSDSTSNIFASNSDLSSKKEYTWNSTTNLWEADAKYNYTYDNNFAFADLVLPKQEFDEEDMIFFNHMLKIMEEFESINGQWKPTLKYNLYYSDFIGNSIEEPKNSSISITPNPANDYFSINMDGNQQINVEIYDANGRKLKTQQLNSSNNISIQNLESGIYFIRITDSNNQIYTRKMIKE